MDLTKFAIEKNRITTVLLLIIIFGGIMAFRAMPQDEDPGFIIRTAMVATYLPGASPERMEKLVTDKLEKKIQEIPELDYVKSESRTGSSIIYVTIKERYKEMRPIWDSLRRKVASAKNQLPSGVYGPYVNDEFGDVYGIVVTLTGDGYSYRELKEVADEVRDEFLRIPDVAKVDIYGAQEEKIFIEFDDSKLARFGLTTYQLSRLLEAQNIITPGGDIRMEREKIVLEPTGNYESVEELKRTVINHPKLPSIIYLKDIANIYRGYVDPPTSKVSANGMMSLGLGLSMREGGNIITLGEDFEKVYERVKRSYPVGIEFDTVAYQPRNVSNKVNEFIVNLLQSVAIVIFVMMISLGLRTGLLVSALIPTTIIMAFMMMSFFDIGIDQVSLAALLITLGMLVDNSIVMSESIMVMMSEGRGALESALASAKELKKPLFTASLTTSAAFLPIFLAQSMTGEYTASLFKVVAITLISSWILALTLIPLLCVKFLKVKKKEDGSYNGRFYKLYRGFIIFILKHGKLTIAVMLVIFGLSLYSFRFIPKKFFPDSDKPIMSAILDLPAGTTFEYTEKVVKSLEKRMRERWLVGKERKKGIRNWAAFMGMGAPRFALPVSPEPPRENYAYVLINTTENGIINEISKDLETYMAKEHPEAEATLKLLPMGPPVKYPVEFRISGKDEEKLFSIAEEVKSRLRSINGTRNVGDNWGQKSKKFVVRIDQERARRAGVTSMDIAVSLQTMLSGIPLTKFREGDKLIPVVLRLGAGERNNVERLKTLNIYSQMNGTVVPLSQVADIEIVYEPSNIIRRNRSTTVTVRSQLLSGHTAAEVMNEIGPWLDKESESWGLGYRWESGGTVESSSSANKSIKEKLPIAGLIILLLLVFQFNSFRKPIVLLSVVPLGIIGVVIGLIVADSYFGFMTLLGVVSLSGIVINNANVLLERIQIELEENFRTPQDAIVEAAQRRLRPIFLTTATTVGGLFPLWIGGGPMWEPMAVAIIFGLIFATVVTLGIVPVVYSKLYRVDFKGYKFNDSEKAKS